MGREGRSLKVDRWTCLRFSWGFGEDLLLSCQQWYFALAETSWEQLKCGEKTKLSFPLLRHLCRFPKEGFYPQGGAATAWISVRGQLFSLVFGSPTIFTARILQNPGERGSLDGAKRFHCWSLSRLEDMFQSSLLLTMASWSLPGRKLITLCSSLFSSFEFMFAWFSR